MSMHSFSTLKAYNRVLWKKHCEVLWEYGVDSHYLLADKSLYSCSDICVYFGGVKSQPFTVGA